MSKMFLNPTSDELLDSQVDVTGAKHVEVKIREDGKVIWVNVDGICLLRACNIQNLVVDNGLENK